MKFNHEQITKHNYYNLIIAIMCYRIFMYYRRGNLRLRNLNHNGWRCYVYLPMLFATIIALQRLISASVCKMSVNLMENCLPTFGIFD